MNEEVNGLICKQCGSYIDGEEPNHRRFCEKCWKEFPDRFKIKWNGETKILRGRY